MTYTLTVTKERAAVAADCSAVLSTANLGARVCRFLDQPSVVSVVMEGEDALKIGIALATYAPEMLTADERAALDNPVI